MYRAIGLSLIGLSGMLGAVLGVWRERRALFVSEGFLGLMRHLCAELERGTATYAEMLGSCEEAVLLACGDPARRSASPQALLAAGGAWLPKEALALLEAGLRDFGKLYREEQCRRCRTCRDALEALCRPMREGLARRERGGAALPLALAAMAVLTLL